jgi:hypothetical protein
MRSVRRRLAFVFLVPFVVIGCGSSETSPTSSSSSSGAGGGGGSPSTSSAGGSGGGGPVTVEVTPAMVDALTCTTTPFSAKVSGTSDTRVTWDAGSTGKIDKAGLYTAPITVPATPSVTITAASVADPSAQGTGTVTLSTAIVGPTKTPVKVENLIDTGAYNHQFVASGAHVYGVFASSDPNTEAGHVSIVASTDGGATWSAPVQVDDSDGTGQPGCTSIAIDAGDPGTVYVAFRYFASVSGDVLAASTDGGHTFANHVLTKDYAGGPGLAADGICVDVISPAPGHVLVESPAGGDGVDHPYIQLFADDAKGAGMTDASDTDGLSASYVGGLSSEGLAGFGPFEDLGYNGGSSNPIESPRLFSDGNGRTCVVYIGGYVPPDGDARDRIYTQCSADFGVTWTPPLAVDTYDSSAVLHHAVGAFAADGTIAVAWWNEFDSLTSSTLSIALSHDHGATFGGAAVVPTYQPPGESPPFTAMQPALLWDQGTLWLLYDLYDGSRNRLVIDKSCDGGNTWSGAQVINGHEPTTFDDADLPSLFLAGGKVAMSSAVRGDVLVPIHYRTLTP